MDCSNKLLVADNYQYLHRLSEQSAAGGGVLEISTKTKHPLMLTL